MKAHKTRTLYAHNAIIQMAAYYLRAWGEAELADKLDAYEPPVIDGGPFFMVTDNLEATDGYYRFGAAQRQVITVSDHQLTAIVCGFGEKRVVESPKVERCEPEEEATEHKRDCGCDVCVMLRPQRIADSAPAPSPDTQRDGGEVVLAPEGAPMAEFQRERTAALSEMLDNPDRYGIYPTSRFYARIDRYVERLITRLTAPPAAKWQAVQADTGRWWLWRGDARGDGIEWNTVAEIEISPLAQPPAVQRGCVDCCEPEPANGFYICIPCAVKRAQPPAASDEEDGEAFHEAMERLGYKGIYGSIGVNLWNTWAAALNYARKRGGPAPAVDLEAMKEEINARIYRVFGAGVDQLERVNVLTILRRHFGGQS